MKVNKAVSKRIQITGKSVNLVEDTNAAIVVNAENKSGHSVVRASGRQRVTQRRG